MQGGLEPHRDTLDDPHCSKKKQNDLSGRTTHCRPRMRLTNDLPRPAQLLAIIELLLELSISGFVRLGRARPP